MMGKSSRYRLIESHHEHRTCGGKVRYTKAKARTMVAVMQKEGVSNLRAYKCPYCRAHHVGKTKYEPGEIPTAWERVRGWM